MRNQFTCIVLHCIFFGAVLFLLGCTKEKDDLKVAATPPESTLKPGDPGYVLTKSDSLLASYIYLENGRYGVALSLDEALSMGINQDSYKEAARQVLETNIAIEECEKRGESVSSAGRSRDEVGKEIVLTKAVEDEDLRPWYYSVSLNRNTCVLANASFKGWYRVKVTVSSSWTYGVYISTTSPVSGDGERSFTGTVGFPSSHIFASGLSDKDGFLNWWFTCRLMSGTGAYVNFVRDMV